MSYEWYLKAPYQEERWCYVDKLFSEEECQNIIKTFTEKGLQPAQVEVDENTELARSSNIIFLDNKDEDSQWIFRKVVDAITTLNNKFYQFDLEKIEILQFTEYDSKTNGFYQKHIDNLLQAYEYRKLSFTIQLSDTKDYDGGELNIYTQEDPFTTVKDQGTLVAFPSYLLHDVTPVTKGTRYSLVGWVVGPKFK